MFSVRRMKLTWLCVIAIAMTGIGAVPLAAQSTQEQHRSERLSALAADFENVVNSLAQQWAQPSGESESALLEMFGALSLSQLLAIQDATSFNDVRLIVLGLEPGNTDFLAALEASPVEPLKLGSLDRDFVYTPVTPCRIVDTRLSGGSLGANTTRNFVVHGGVVGQGGNPAGCPSPRGEPRAVHLNVTVVPVNQATGFVKVYPFSTPEPNASLVNFRSGTTIANAATIETCFLCGPDITVKVSQRVHIVIDALGYYHEADEVVEHVALPSCGNIATAPAMSNCGSISINVPGPGKVIVRAKANAITFGEGTRFTFGIGNNTSSIVEGALAGATDGSDSKRRNYNVVDEVVFTRSGAGIATYQINAQKSSVFNAKTVNVFDIRATALYVAD